MIALNYRKYPDSEEASEAKINIDLANETLESKYENKIKIIVAALIVLPPFVILLLAIYIIYGFLYVSGPSGGM